MHKSLLLTTSVVLFLATTVEPAFSCGESLFRVGKGMAYREYTAPLPGNIVVVAQSEEDLAFLELIAAAGHHVTVVPTAYELPEQLNHQDFDIILAPFGDRNMVAEGMSGSLATYLPVAQHDSEEPRLARELYPEYLESNDSLKRFLKVIHKTMKHRQA